MFLALQSTLILTRLSVRLGVEFTYDILSRTFNFSVFFIFRQISLKTCLYFILREAFSLFSVDVVIDLFEVNSLFAVPFLFFILIFFLKILFFPFSPQSPPVHSFVFFVVGPSSCGVWDAASAWFDEQCHVRAQDSNQRNTGPPAAERTNLTTRPWGQPRILLIFYGEYCPTFL